MKNVRVLELFSGIGGWSFALRDCVAKGVIQSFDVVAARDQNTLANSVYCLNFPNVEVNRSLIEAMDLKWLSDLNADTVLLSPPCQPFTCQDEAKRLGLLDNRCKALVHFLDLLTQLSPDSKPQCLLLENVVGFQDSDAHRLVKKTLESCNYVVRECVLSPIDLGIPNSRRRFFLLANLGNPTSNTESPSYVRTCKEVAAYLDPKIDFHEFAVPATIVSKYLKAMDIVTPASHRSTCFTKNYVVYAKGTGSVLDISPGGAKDTSVGVDRVSSEFQLRYFSPLEVSTLLGFKELQWPEKVSRKQRYKLLGNSLNVEVASVMLTKLFNF